ncbi:MAG: histidine phosphatase family protein [Clostridia bacterium]|nr:histidine phosphatase family protein [Clostridia bacterium]
MDAATPIILRELYLIRHGQSLGNIDGIPADAGLIEKEDPALSPLGERQALQLGLFYAETPFAAVYASALQRAIQTAAGLLSAKAAPQPVMIEPLLTEIGLDPAFEGRTRAALRQVCPLLEFPEGPLIQSNAFHDEAAAFARARALFAKLFAQYQKGEKIALVSHAGILTFLIFELIGYHEHQPFDFRLTNTGVTRVVFYQPGTNPYGDMVFDCVNDCSHLLRAQA